MATGRRVGQAAGFAISLGIGVAVAMAGAGQAAADPGEQAQSSKPSGAARSSGAAQSSGVARAEPSRPSGAADMTAPEPDRTDRSERDREPDDTDTEPQSDTEPDPADEAADSNAAEERDDADADAVSAGEDDDASANEDRSATVTFDPPAGADQSRPERRPAAPVHTQALTAVLAGARRPETAAAPVAGTTVTSTAVAGSALPTATASVAAPDPLSGATRVGIDAVATDGDPLTYRASRPRLGTVASHGDGEFTYTPTTFTRILARILPFIRSDRFTVTVTDAHGAATTVTVTTPIVPINAAPKPGTTAVNAPTAATGTVTGRLKAVDSNRDKLSYLPATIDTGRGVVTVNADGSFSYTPTAAARHTAAADGATATDRTDSFTARVSDAWGAATDITVRVTISPANTAPTGTATMHTPDETTGVVVGSVAGRDADADHLVYGGSATTARGTVVVTADGVITYAPHEDARRLASSVYSTPALRTDAFTVTVADGHGGRTAIPVTVTITPLAGAPVAVPPSTFCGCTLMPGDSIFHADLRGLPTLAESATWIELLGGGRGATLHARWGGDQWMGSTAGIPVNVVSADHPLEVVIFNRGYSTSGPGIDDRPYAIPDRPLVEGMPSYPAWDRHLLVFQEGTCISQELINVANGVELPGAGILDILGNAAYRALWGSSWIAEAGAQYDMSSALYPVKGHANASRLPFVPMMLRPDEIERGYVDHMLGVVIAKGKGAGYTWPALAGDGSAADGVPMGMVFRLREDIDISGYAASTQAVLRALQIHGAVVYDSGPEGDGMALSGMSNGWDGTDYRAMQRELSTIPLDWFQAVDVAGIAADPTVGWHIR